MAAQNVERMEQARAMGIPVELLYFGPISYDPDSTAVHAASGSTAAQSAFSGARRSGGGTLFPAARSTDTGIHRWQN